MRGRRPENYHVIREFGAIGNGISLAIGVAAARKDGKTVLFDGDGGFLMHVQELETVRRHGLKLLFVVFNDGAYGSEIHKLRADGIDDSGSIFGRTDLAADRQGLRPARGDRDRASASSGRCSRPIGPRTRRRSGTSISLTRLRIQACGARSAAATARCSPCTRLVR